MDTDLTDAGTPGEPLDPSGLERLASAITRSNPSGRVVVLIDGRSGSGKTVLAQGLAPRLGAQLVSLDDVYPGWDGLEAGSTAVHETMLRSRDPGWRRWDWATDGPAEWHPIDPERPLIVEGCGALSRTNRAMAGFGIWLELDAAERRRRASARDLGRFDPYWDRWAAQEDAFDAREHPRRLADLVIAA
ncbi:ATP-binding protein [Lysinimonas soli]|uniref:ATP-binding protein n=1 Tax=Lysinimonas soli TaxID=1074233 RepID=A0ABW0NS26_9MICO